MRLIRPGSMIAAALVVAAAVAVPTTTALAGDSSYCTGAWACVYKDSNFGTPLGYRTSGFALQNISPANANEISSWEDRTSRAARWYTGTYGGGTCNNMAKNSELSYMNPITQNDNMESWAGDGAC